MNYFKVLKSRQLLKDSMNTADAYMNKAIYCGFDPTASSLHLGHMITLNSLVYAAALGYTPIVVLGTATAEIGDPSGKSESRPLLDKQLILSNSQSLFIQISQVFSKLQEKYSVNTKPLKIIENSVFYEKLSFISFLREVGLFFPINPLLHREFIENRKDKVSYTEFSYSLLQAYDFYMLFLKHDCVGQIGGSDQ